MILLIFAIDVELSIAMEESNNTHWSHEETKFFLCTVACASDLEVEREVIAHAHYQPKNHEVS